ncbi:MAG: serine/threonine protein kinase, partial [Thermobispora bispora]|nr:serine/threonine protein kinase [Thermobispora bispora]
VLNEPGQEPRPFIVMQFVEGVTLDDVLSEHHPLPVNWVAAVAAQIAAVLCAAHERGILHRDLKPSNLMLTREGTVKVLDFGLAMFHDPELSRLTRTGTILGTPAYMSPEQVRGATVGPQSDLYALGLVLHELLTGRRLYDGPSEYRIFERQVNETAPPVRDRRPEVPPELDRLVLQLLEKRAENRPSQARLVYDRLLPFVSGVRSLPGTVHTAWTPARLYEQVVVRIDAVTAAEPAHDAGPPEAPHEELGTVNRQDIERARREAALLVRESRYGQAFEVLEAVAVPAARVLGEVDPDVLDLRLEMAKVLFEGGDYRRAAPAFGALHADLARVHGPADDRVFQCRQREATCRALMGQTGEALRMLQALLADEEAAYGVDDPRPLELRQQIGLMQLGAGDTDRARMTLAGLLDDLTRLYGPEHPIAAKVRESLRRLAI